MISSLETVARLERATVKDRLGLWVTRVRRGEGVHVIKDRQREPRG